MVRLVHISSAHLGYSGQRPQQVVPAAPLGNTLVNQIEADILLGLDSAVDRIVTEIHPEVVLYTGNLFDSPRPTALYIDFAMTQLKRLTGAGIYVVLIEGNHSYPRDPSQGHPLSVLAHLPGVRAVYDDYDTVQIGNVLIHALPNRAVACGTVPRVQDLDPNSVNVLAAHCVANGYHFFRTGRSAPDLAIGDYASGYHYVALGHARHFAQVPYTDRAFYAGATAMVTWGDFRPDYQFGFNVVDLELGGYPDPPAPNVKRILLTTRPMHSYGLHEAGGYSPDEIIAFLRAQAAELSPSEAYCKVDVRELDPLTRRQLSIRQVEDIFRDAAAYQINLNARDLEWSRSDRRGRGSLDPLERFYQLASDADGDDAFKAEVQTLGHRFLSEAAKQVGADDSGQVDEA